MLCTGRDRWRVDENIEFFRAGLRLLGSPVECDRMVLRFVFCGSNLVTFFPNPGTIFLSWMRIAIDLCRIVRAGGVQGGGTVRTQQASAPQRYSYRLLWRVLERRGRERDHGQCAGLVGCIATFYYPVDYYGVCPLYDPFVIQFKLISLLYPTTAQHKRARASSNPAALSVSIPVRGGETLFALILVGM